MVIMSGWLFVLLCYGFFTFLLDIASVLDEPINTLEEVLADALNPIAIYQSTNVNVFGCIMLTILGHLLLPWVAPFYWFYKLCTVGRR